jgi:hypothetical protein
MRFTEEEAMKFRARRAGVEALAAPIEAAPPARKGPLREPTCAPRASPVTAAIMEPGCAFVTRIDK